MFKRIVRALTAAVLAVGLITSIGAVAGADDGVVRIKSHYPMSETIERLKADIESKKITSTPRVPGLRTSLPAFNVRVLYLAFL